MTPSSSPTTGAHAIAAATVAGARGGSAARAVLSGAGGSAPRHGITVSSVTDSLRPIPLMPEEPTGRPPKDVLSQTGGRKATRWRWHRRVRVVVDRSLGRK